MRTSHPAWDAWIEIVQFAVINPTSSSHPAWDAWIEIEEGDVDCGSLMGRIPHGMRGLK